MNTAKEAETIKVVPDIELDRLLDEASRAPLLLERDGERYRLERGDIWAGYEPEKVRASVTKYAGSWKDVDVEAFKTFIARAREEGTKLRVKP